MTAFYLKSYLSKPYTYLYDTINLKKMYNVYKSNSNRMEAATKNKLIK